MARGIKNNKKNLRREKDPGNEFSRWLNPTKVVADMSIHFAMEMSGLAKIDSSELTQRVRGASRMFLAAWTRSAWNCWQHGNHYQHSDRLKLNEPEQA